MLARAGAMFPARIHFPHQQQEIAMQVCRIALYAVSVFIVGRFSILSAQSLGGAGTVEGVVIDPSGAAVVNAQVAISNTITGYKQQTKSDTTGNFKFSNVPPNPYHLQVTAAGFSPFAQDLAVRTSVPISLKVPL